MNRQVAQLFFIQPQMQTGNGKVSKILIVDGYPIFRQGLVQILSPHHDVSVCGVAATAAQGVDGASRLRPDLVLLDVSLPDRSGLEAIKKIRGKHSEMKILAVSMHDETVYAPRVLRLGGNGYIMKREEPAEVLSAIRRVLGGETYLSPAMLARKKSKIPRSREIRPLDALTDSQLEIVELLGQGTTYAEMAARLGQSALAIVSECEAIRKTLRLRSENALIRYAVHWLELEIK